MSTHRTAKRYVAEQTITTPGEYYDTTGRWTVRDTQPVNAVAALPFASGHERQMKRWAHGLNAR